VNGAGGVQQLLRGAISSFEAKIAKGRKHAKKAESAAPGALSIRETSTFRVLEARMAQGDS
jgi:hypothetical protein